MTAGPVPHAGPEGVDSVEDPGQHDRDESVETLGRHVDEFVHVWCHAGVVHEDLDRAEGVLDDPPGLLPASTVPHIEVVRECGRAEPGSFPCDCCGVPVREYHPRPGGDQRLGGAQPDAAAGAGD